MTSSRRVITIFSNSAPMERRMHRKLLVRCGNGENLEIVSGDYLLSKKGSHGLVDIDVEFRGNWHVGDQVHEIATEAMSRYAIKKTYTEYDIMNKSVLGDGYNEG